MTIPTTSLSFPIFRGLDPEVFKRALDRVEKAQWCCCPSISCEAGLCLYNGDRQDRQPYLDAFASVFRPPGIASPNEPWWDVELKDTRNTVFDLESRAIALLLCAEFAREANEAGSLP